MRCGYLCVCVCAVSSVSVTCLCVCGQVRCGYLQMDNCIMEDGMMCVVNPAACHIQFCTFRHATVILQHVGASIITNCEFSQSDNANIVVEGG